MRNSIVLKFIALFLCAASLLGVVGSAGGILVLTETGMYEKTANQLYEENLTLFAQMLSNSVARDYAERQLGGCPELMISQVRNFNDSAFVSSRYGYSLMDAEGRELEHKNLNYDGDVMTLTFPVTGQYMHLVEVVSDSQKQAEREQISVQRAGNGPVYLDQIPLEGSKIAQMEIVTVEGDGYFHTKDLGTAFRNQNGQMIFRCAAWTVDRINASGTDIAYISLWDDGGNLVYLAEDAKGIGTLRPTTNGETLIFESWHSLIQVLEETIPAETAEETVPAATVETVPEEQEETTPAEDEKTEDSGEKTDEKKSEKTEDFEGKTDEKKSEKTEDSEEKTDGKKDDTEGEAATEPEAQEEAVPHTEPAEETVPEETVPEPVLIQGKPLGEYQVNSMRYWDTQRQENVTAKYVYVPMPPMTVEFFVAPEALNQAYLYTVLGMVGSVQRYLLPTLGICLLLMAVTAVYLCCSAGRKPKSEEVRAGGLNRMPVDGYGFLAIGGVTLCALVAVEGGEYFLRRNVLMGCAFAAGMAFLACLLVVGFFFALVAQIKTPGGFWWRNSLVGWCLKLVKYLWNLFIRFTLWVEEKMVSSGLPLLSRMMRWLWSLVSRLWKWFWNLVKNISKAMVCGLDRFCELLPLTWQWMLAGFVMVMLLFVTVAERFELGIVLSILFAFALILYGAHCFGILLETTKKMNKGDLDNKVDDKLMVGTFKTFAKDLNDLAGVAVVAAKKQLKSERMKTELITNVSHDIKTPLTSIINYVDLLLKPHTEEEQQQYLEVLDRQSQRLKKLIEDLMDMSKASTGNMAVDITLVDAVESVNQALGEFGDKLERAQLIPVFRHTETSVPMMADGKLVWRVLSNLLSNAVKYAMPGTRLYIDLMTLENKVVISLKNISREELNVDAEELMERFVRGDDSRNTEGSGLGLNIARSLMELQKGQLQLLVDGDLFKVTLIFPGV